MKNVIPAHVELEFLVEYLVFPAQGIELQQFLRRILLLINKRRP